MKPYRINVGIVVFNSFGLVLTGERLQFAGAWQFPQGGVDAGEEPIVTARRELYEEVGIRDAIFVHEKKDWLKYDFPPELKDPRITKYQGQSQKWFLFYWNHPIEDCNLEVHEREFTKVQFMPIRDTLKSIVPFKLDVYKEIVNEFEPIIKDYVVS